MRQEFFMLCAVCFLLLACGGPSLPETYGVYGVDGRTTIRLKDGEEIEVFGPKVSFILFDKVIGSGLLGQGAIPLEHVVAVENAAYVRYAVERVKARQGGEVKEVRITQAGRLAALDSAAPVPVEYSPIKDQPEMLKVIPTAPLARGCYSLRFDTQRFMFTVGIKEDQIAASSENRCKDQHANSRAPSKGFSWSDWFSLTQGSEKSKSGNWLENTGLLDCAVLDEQAAGWRAEAHRALAEDKLREAFMPTELFFSYDAKDGKPLVEELESKLRAAANVAFAAAKWESAIDFASMALEISPENEEMSTVVTTSRRRMEEAVAAARAAAAATRTRRIKESKTRTKSFGKMQLAVRETFKEPEPGPIVEITDVGLFGATKDKYYTTETGDPNDFAWYCEFWHKHPIESLGRKFLGTYKARFADQSDFMFLTEEERDRFVALVTRAVEEWNKNFSDVREDYKCGKN